MHGRANTTTIAFLAALAASASVAGIARADEKEACVAASEQAQTLRDEGKYGAARAAMVTCARDVCPSIVRRDCDKWLGDLDGMQPTVVLGARDPKGNDVPGTHVLLDGVLFVEHLEGKPVAVDPGEHVFRYEAPGVAPVEQRAVVRVNEKNRVLTAILMASTAPPILAASPAPEASGGTGSGSVLSRVPVASWVLLGVAGVSAASFAYFGLSGQSDVSNLRATCGVDHDCPQDQVDAAHTKLIVADVSLGVGVVSLVAAAWVFLRRPPAAATATGTHVDLQPRAGGGVATISVRF